MIHEVNKILVPPTQNILELIEKEPKYSTLRKILKDTEVEKILQENNRSITFLAPTDETFAALDEKDLNTLLENKEKANVVLKHHVLTGNSFMLYEIFPFTQSNTCSFLVLKLKCGKTHRPVDF